MIITEDINKISRKLQYQFPGCNDIVTDVYFLLIILSFINAINRFHQSRCFDMAFCGRCIKIYRLIIDIGKPRNWNNIAYP